MFPELTYRNFSIVVLRKRAVCKASAGPSPTVLRPDIALGKGEERGAQRVAAANAELVVDGLQPRLDGAHREIQPLRDGLVRQSVCRVARRFQFSLRQLVVRRETLQRRGDRALAPLRHRHGEAPGGTGFAAVLDKLPG